MPRRFQFSLRTLLILTTICAIGLGWWSHKARQQREAVARLNKHGSIAYDFELAYLNPAGTSSLRPPYWPAWLVNTMGVDYFANVSRVNLSNSSVTDADLSCLKAFRSLDILDLNNAQQVTDAGLLNLREITSLRVLQLAKTQITDEGLGHLAGLPGLKGLQLSYTNLTDAGLDRLKGFTGLEELYVGDTHVTYEGVTRLKQARPNCQINYAPLKADLELVPFIPRAAPKISTQGPS